MLLRDMTSTNVDPNPLVSPRSKSLLPSPLVYSFQTQIDGLITSTPNVPIAGQANSTLSSIPEAEPLISPKTPSLLPTPHRWSGLSSLLPRALSLGGLFRSPSKLHTPPTLPTSGLSTSDHNITSSTTLDETSQGESKSEFLQRRRTAAAQYRQKVSGDPNSPASQQIVKRRTEVLNTVQKARSRLSQLSHETVRRKRTFGKGLVGRFQRWVFQREQKRLRGKGTTLLRLWLESLRSMENTYGSSLMLAFSFIRWVFLLNSVLALLWLVAMIIPFMAFPPSTFNWKQFLTTMTMWKKLKYILQGEDLEKTFVYYGGYTYQPNEQQGWYRVDYMYPVLIGATFLFSFLGALGRIAGRIMDSGDIAMAARLYPFSILAFASWDFHLTSLEAANKLRRGIRMQLYEMWADTKLKEHKTGIIDRLISAKVVFCNSKTLTFGLTS